MRNIILTVAGVVLMSGPAWAAEPPTDPTAELKSLSALAGDDVLGALLRAEDERVAKRVFTAPPEPLASVMGSVCASTSPAIEQGYGRYVARHVREPIKGVPKALQRMGADFRRHIRTVSKTLPEGKPSFLLPGERLWQPPKTWEQAARQRAEWVKVLETLTDRLVDEADGRRKYEAYAAAGMWTRLDCLSARTDGRFLQEFEAAGARADDERTAAALALLKSRAAASR